MPAGKFVYPGMIDSKTDIGLCEIGSVAATQDVSEQGTYNPHMKAIVAVNPEQRADRGHACEWRDDDAHCARRWLLSGQAALIHLDGWTQDENGCCARSPASSSIIRAPVVVVAAAAVAVAQGPRILRRSVRRSSARSADRRAARNT